MSFFRVGDPADRAASTDPAQAEAMVRDASVPWKRHQHLWTAVVTRSDGVRSSSRSCLRPLSATPMSDRAIPQSIRAALETRLVSLPKPPWSSSVFAAVLGRQFRTGTWWRRHCVRPQDAIDRLRTSSSARTS